MLKIQEIEVKSVMTKSNLPVADFSVNPYVGCLHGCKYCYASFMKRFTNHPEPWGEFINVKYWPEIKNAKRYAGKEAFFGSVTDCYQLYHDIYTKKDRTYWMQLDMQLRTFCEAEGLPYVRNDDSVRSKHGEPPVVVNYFFHEEIVNRSK